MGQKLQFVTTVLHEPKLIILDEPFSGLDPVNSNLIKDEIFNLAQGGSTIIFSTHRMEQVEEICNHIVLVNKGKKILDGTVKGIKQDFKENIYSVGMNQPLSQVPATAPFELTGHIEDRHVIRIKEGSGPNEVLRYLLDQGGSIHSFNEILPSLNDIFIKLGGRHPHGPPVSTGSRLITFQTNQMNKIFIIIRREYLTRVRKKTFIISTLLFPLLYLALIFGMGFIAEKANRACMWR
jgi:hypothetical protein